MPLHVPPHALAEGRRGAPAELRCRALAGQLEAAEVRRASRRVHDVHIADDLADGVRHLADRYAALADEVEDPVGARGPERADDTVRKVLHVDEAARLQSFPGNLQRLTGERARHEGRHDRSGPGTRPVRDPEAQDRVLQAVEPLVRPAVHLAGELRRRIEVARQAERRILVDQAFAAVAVHPDRARIHHAPHPAGARGLQDIQRPARVRRLGRARLPGDPVDIRGGGEVDDGVAAFHRAGERPEVREVADHRVDGARRVVGRRAQIEDARLDPGVPQRIDDMRADKSGAACDEHLSRRLPWRAHGVVVGGPAVGSHPITSVSREASASPAGR